MISVTPQTYVSIHKSSTSVLFWSIVQYVVLGKIKRRPLPVLYIYIYTKCRCILHIHIKDKGFMFFAVCSYKQIFVLDQFTFLCIICFYYILFSPFLTCQTFLIDITFLKVEFYNTFRRKMAKYLIYI